jgi:phosphoesterase RecJ-like protein
MVLNCIFARMNSKDVQTIRELLSTSRKIAIVPHKNPDGDAVGASLALWHYLDGKGHKACVVVPNDYPKFLKWMPGTDRVLNFEKDGRQSAECIEEAGIIFTLDFNQLDRAGSMQPALESARAAFVMIDHHQEPGTYARVTYSDTAMSSTCEMVYTFIEALGDTDVIGPEIANCLYAGIVTDTGSFKYPATSSRTHRVAASLIDKGALNTEIHNRIFDTNTPDRLHLLGCALRNMVILKEFSTAYISLSQEELDAFHYKKGDTEGFVNYGLTLEGIHFAAIFIESREDGIVKISLRSEGDFSVNEFARAHFEGGGHLNAAGGKSNIPLKETIEYFVSLLPRYKKELNK